MTVSRSIDQKFSIINRETKLIAELVTSGLENIRKIHLNQAFYYQSFYAMSMGLERLMKLIVHIEQPTANPFKLGHDLGELSNFLNIIFPFGSIENNIIIFLSAFAKGDRYTMVDFLYHGDSTRLAKEPILNFYTNILRNILLLHPPKKTIALPDLSDLGYVLSIKEDLTEIQSLTDLIEHNQLIEHGAKYCAMYMGRVLMPFVDRLVTHEGNPNPHFSEHFKFLFFTDEYFLTRKTYRG